MEIMNAFKGVVKKQTSKDKKSLILMILAIIGALVLIAGITILLIKVLAPKEAEETEPEEPEDIMASEDDFDEKIDEDDEEE